MPADGETSFSTFEVKEEDIRAEKLTLEKTILYQLNHIFFLSSSVAGNLNSDSTENSLRKLQGTIEAFESTTLFGLVDNGYYDLSNKIKKLLLARESWMRDSRRTYEYYQILQEWMKFLGFEAKKAAKLMPTKELSIMCSDDEDTGFIEEKEL